MEFLKKKKKEKNIGKGRDENFHWIFFFLLSSLFLCLSSLDSSNTNFKLIKENLYKEMYL